MRRRKIEESFRLFPPPITFSPIYNILSRVSSLLGECNIINENVYFLVRQSCWKVEHVRNTPWRSDKAANWSILDAIQAYTIFAINTGPCVWGQLYNGSWSASIHFECTASNTSCRKYIVGIVVKLITLRRNALLANKLRHWGLQIVNAFRLKPTSVTNQTSYVKFRGKCHFSFHRDASFIQQLVNLQAQDRHDFIILNRLPRTIRVIC